MIETVNDQLKNISCIKHSRHRSMHGFMLNLLGGIIAYCQTASDAMANTMGEVSGLAGEVAKSASSAHELAGEAEKIGNIIQEMQATSQLLK